MLGRNRRNQTRKISFRNVLGRNRAVQNEQGAINMNTKYGLTNEKIYDKMIIANGSQGPNVIKLQNSLNELSKKYNEIPVLKVDGIFGEKTNDAVMIFQGLFNLTTDGVVGRYTWTAINDALLGKIVPQSKEEEN